MGTVSAGGALLPYQDQEFKGNLTVDGNVTVKGKITQAGTGDTFVNATLTGTTTIGVGATLTSPTLVTPALGTPASGVATNLTGTATGLTTGGVQSPSAAIGYATGAGGTVTQITNSSTGVTINKPVGTIVTVALTTAAGAHEKFTVTNSFCAAVTDVIVFSSTYAGGASHGTPLVQACNVTAGTFDIVIANVDATNALNAAMTINFAILTAVAA